MKTIIDTLSTSLFNETPLPYHKDFPIKIVHEQRRVSNAQSLHKLQERRFFDAKGFSPRSLSQEEVAFLLHETPELIQKVSYAITCNDVKTFAFVEKFAQDRWKKYQDAGTLEAVIEMSRFEAHDTNAQIETALRNILRSRKEVPLLKQTAFVWVAYSQKSHEPEPIMQHYFKENRSVLSKGSDTIHIGWSTTLGGINMRHFVYTPQ